MLKGEGEIMKEKVMQGKAQTMAHTTQTPLPQSPTLSQLYTTHFSNNILKLSSVQYFSKLLKPNVNHEIFTPFMCVHPFHFLWKKTCLG